MMPPPPPPRPPRKKANPWLILAIVIGVLIVIGAIANTAKSSPSIQATATAGVVQATATPIPTNTPVPLTQTVSSDVHFKAGEAASTPDGYAVTLNKTYTSAGGEFDTPAKGNQYFVVDVSVKNGTGKNELMSSNQFTLTDSTGQRIDDTIASLPNVHAYIGGTLANDKTMRGQLVYEVPTGKHPYELAFAVNTIYSDYQIIWDINT